jgi:hypothetical protein
VPLYDGKVTIFECGEKKLLSRCPKWQPNTCVVAKQRWNDVSRHPNNLQLCSGRCSTGYQTMGQKWSAACSQRAGAPISLRQWCTISAQATKRAHIVYTKTSCECGIQSHGEGWMMLLVDADEVQLELLGLSARFGP